MRDRLKKGDMRKLKKIYISSELQSTYFRQNEERCERMCLPSYAGSDNISQDRPNVDRNCTQ